MQVSGERAAEGDEIAPIGLGVVLNAYVPSTRKLLDELCAALSSAIGVEVTADALESYQHLLDALRDGRVGLAWLPPLVALRAGAGARVSPIARPIRHGKREHHAVLVVRDDSPIRGLDDIRATTVGWVDRRSATGYALIRAQLRALGLRPDEAFASERFLGSHAEVVRAVVDGDIALGATFAHPGQKGTWSGSWGSQRVRVITDVGPVPPDLLASTSRVPQAAVRAVLRALMSSERGPARQAACSLFGADSFALPDPRYFDRIESLAEDLALETEEAGEEIADPLSEDAAWERPSVPPQDDRQVGLIIAGKYRLDRPLKQGGMGALWLATHLDLGTTVAVKLIRAGLGEGARARFTREAKAVATIRSTNVVQILDYGVDRGMPYMVMELLEGEDLGVRLKRMRRLSLGDTLALMRPIARALDRAHAAGLVHRDLKPTNIFIARDGDEDVPKILDFGIAKALRSSDPAGENTSEGMVLGSPYYMSPEQATGRADIDHRADLWSLGILAFRCITGNKPFGDGPMGAVILQICSSPIPKATTVAPDLPPVVDAFFERALSRDRDQRFQSAKELVTAFELLVPAQDALVPALRDSLSDSGAVRIPVAARPVSGGDLTPPPAAELDSAPASQAPGPLPAAPRRTTAILAGLSAAATLALALVLALRADEAPTDAPTATPPTAQAGRAEEIAPPAAPSATAMSTASTGVTAASAAAAPTTIESASATARPATAPAPPAPKRPPPAKPRPPPEYSRH